MIEGSAKPKPIGGRRMSFELFSIAVINKYETTVPTRLIRHFFAFLKILRK
jgi:hypothetical protein